MGELAHKFRDCFPKGVIEVKKNKNQIDEAVVINPRRDTVSREVLRHSEFDGIIKLTRVMDHFICKNYV